MKKIKKLLGDSKYGFTITELTTKSKYPRCKIRIILAMLEGAEEIEFRKVGKAKVYNLRKGGRR